MTGAGNAPNKMTFKFSKSPQTSQIYLDNFGTMCVTDGWPHSRPMAGQVGEIIDVQSVFASIRWTRKEDVNATTAFGAAQTVLPLVLPNPSG